MLNRVIFWIILYTKENKYNILVVFSFVFSILILGEKMHMIDNKVTDVKPKVKAKQNTWQLYKGIIENIKYKSKVPRCTTGLYNKRQNVTNKVRVQYMALCNTVRYDYGKYIKDKVRHYKL